MPNGTTKPFAVMGVTAVVLDSPFFYGWLNIGPLSLYVAAPGLIFGLAMTVAALWASGDFSRRDWSMRYIVGGVVLAIGMPAALATGAASFELLDVKTLANFNLRGIGLPFFLGEILSCVAWSIVMSIWMAVVKRIRPVQIVQVAVPVTIGLMLLANVAEVVSKALWQKSVLLSITGITEQVASALILSIASPITRLHRQNVVSS